MTIAAFSLDTSWRRRDLWLLLSVMLLVGWVRSFPMVLPSLELRAQAATTFQNNDSLSKPRSNGSTPPPADVRQHGRQLAEQLRQRYSFEAKDGTLYPYPYGIDSYGWLHWARNWLEHGNSCDQVVEGECLDQLTLAPWGKELIYGDSLHIPAIAWLHRLIRTLAPDIPLLGSALWLQLLLGVMAVVPAYLLGQRLGGTVGGLTAAVLVSLNTAVLGRTIGTDNDIWSVLLVLAQQWALIAAVLSREYPKALAYVAVGAVFTALWAGVWSGWVYGYALACATLLGYGLVQLAAQRSTRQLGRGLSLLPVYFLLTWALLQFTAPQTDYLEVPLALLRHYFGAGTADVSSGLHWPDVFATVGELQRPGGLAGVAAALGGESVLLVAYLGLLLVCLPMDGWRRWEPAVLVLGVISINALGLLHPDSPAVNQTVLALPLLAALAVRLGRGGPNAAAQTAAALALVVWCLSTLELGFSAARFLMLFTIPWAVAVGVATGRIYVWLGRELEQSDSAVRRIGKPLMGLVLGVVLILLAVPGIALSWQLLPLLTSPKVEAFKTLDARAEPDAIVTDLWERGYWIKYFGRRAVHHDGGTLGTHVPYWVGRFYAARDDRAAVGVLRMLNCGSDATPLPEGRHGALQRLQAAGLAPPQALVLLNRLITLDRSAAAALLRETGLEPDRQAAILESSHCQPPQSWIFATPSYLYKFRAWLKLALWDPLLPLGEQGEIATRYYPPRRLSCSDTSERVLECRLDWALSSDQTATHTVTVFLDRPREAVISGPQGEALGSPGLVAVVQQGEIEYFAAPAPGSDAGPSALRLQRLGLLVDIEKGTVANIPPDVLHSTMLRLAFIDGYRSEWFESAGSFDETAGGNIKLWRVKRWE